MTTPRAGRHATPAPTAQAAGGRDSVIFYAADEPHEKVGTKAAGLPAELETRTAKSGGRHV